MNLRFLTITIVASTLFTASSPARAQDPPAPPPLAPRAAPSAAPAPDPLEPKWDVRSPAAVFAGSGLLIAGVGASVAGLLLFLQEAGFKCESDPCPHHTTGPLVLLFSGVGALAAGTTLLIWGVQDPPEGCGACVGGRAGRRWVEVAILNTVDQTGFGSRLRMRPCTSAASSEMSQTR